MAKYKVSLNGKIYEVEVEKGEAILLDEYELVAPKAAPAVASAPAQVEAPVQASAPAVNAGASAVKAPLPGVVVAVKAQVGQAVKAGETVLIIEAMKMENEIVAPCAGTVSQVLVSKGSTVETDAVLAVIS